MLLVLFATQGKHFIANKGTNAVQPEQKKGDLFEEFKKRAIGMTSSLVKYST